MTTVYVELSQESPVLARAEALAAAEVLSGGGSTNAEVFVPFLVPVDLPRSGDAAALAARLALARRVLAPRGTGSEVPVAMANAGASGGSAAVRRLGRPTGGRPDDGVTSAGRSYVEGGGRIDLERPSQRFWLARDAHGADLLFEEVAAVDRIAASLRRMPRLPFQRPVSLDPRLARAAANLARVKPGDRVLDPFVGTGALLAEAGLLGARLFGIDRDAEMVRGSVRNLAHLGLTAEALVVGDAGAVDVGEPGGPFDAILTDPPYGRSSSTGGEEPATVVERVLTRWSPRVRPGGWLMVVTPEVVEPPDETWRPVDSIPVRVHRSLTRRFQTFRRSGLTTR